MKSIPGGWAIDKQISLSSGKVSRETVCSERHVNIYRNILDIPSVERVNLFMNGAPNFAPVTVQGLQDVTDDNIGSFRSTMWNPAMASQLAELFKPHFPTHNLHAEDTFASDWWQNKKKKKKHREWKWVGVSPMLRYMRYPKGGKHACHYDAGFINPDNIHRTLFSFVLYFSTNKTGATRIIRDGQEHLPVWERNHADWDRDVKPEEIVAESYPQAGSVLIFPHRVPHDVQPYDGAEGDRIIIRGDLYFEKV